MKLIIPKYFVRITVALFILNSIFGTGQLLHAQTGIINTIVGTGVAGFSGDGGPAITAQLDSPIGVWVDGSANVYIADHANHRIREVNGATGVINTIAGNGTIGYAGDGGLATLAKLHSPCGICLDGAGNLYIADFGNNVVRMVTAATGIITTVAGTGVAGFSGDGGAATTAQLHSPYGVWVDPANNLYITDQGNHRVRVVNLSTGIINTFAGNGGTTFCCDGSLATTASFSNPAGIVKDAGGIVYFSTQAADARVRKVLTTGIIETEMGDGVASYSGDCGMATNAEIQWPQGLALDNAGNVYLATSGDYRIRMVTSATGIINTIAGNGTTSYSGDGGPALSAGMIPLGVYVAGNGNFFITDEHRVRMVTVVSSGTLDFCQYDSILLGSTRVTADTFLWSTGATTETIEVTSPGTYWVRTDSSICTYTDTFYVDEVLKPVVNLGPNDSICTGTAVTLASTVAYDTTSTYLWSTGNTTATITTSVAATYWLAVTDSGCTGSDTLIVALKPPIPVNLGNDTAFCIGNTDTLYSHDSTTGATFLWSTGATDSAIAVTTSGTYWLTVNIDGCSGSDTVIVTVNPLPVAIAGPDTVCADGGTAALTDTSGGGAGTWKITNTNAGISTTGLVTGNIAGLDTVTYTLSTGCSIDLPITVNPLPGIPTGTDSVCVGSSVILSDTSAGGTWSSSTTGITTVTATGGVATGITAGAGNILYTLITGCSSSFALTVNPLPDTIAGSDAVCLRSTITLTDASGGGTWSSSDTTIATIDGSGVVTGVNTGTTIITYTLITGCYSVLKLTVENLPNGIGGPDSVCVDAQIPLNDASSGGTWSVTSTTIATVSATGTITGIASGTDTVIYTLGTGCSVSMAFTVNPIPDAITGTANVCVNATTTMSDATTGGTWSIAPGTIASVSATGVITGLTAGVAFLTYTLPTGCYVTEEIVVDALPGTISGDTILCPGATSTLTDAPGGGTWTVAPAAVSSIIAVTGVLTANASGTATVTYTTRAGCIATTTVIVNPQPPAFIIPIGDTQLCPGGFVALTANTGIGLTYQWGVGGLPITGATTSDLIAAIAGQYSVTVTNSFGCGNTAMINVSIDPIAATITAAGATTFCGGLSVVLNANTGAGLSYQWLRNGLPLAGGTGASYTALLGGNYAVAETNTAGCNGYSDTISVTVLAAPSGTITLSGPDSMCAGNDLTMTGDTGVGMTYQWNDNGTAIAGATSIAFTTDSGGNYTVLETNSLGCVTTSTAVAVTIDPLPADSIVAAGSSVFCPGGYVVLDAPVGTGYTYQWYLNGITVTGAVNAVDTARTGGLYTVLVTTSLGCSATTPAGFVVTEISDLNIIPLTPTSYCWGSSVDLTVAVPGVPGVAFQWYTGGSAIAGATDNTYNATMPSGYNCIVTVAGGACTTNTDTVAITLYPLPDPVITYSLGVLSTQTYFSTYQWYEDMVAISGATTYWITPATDGSYKVAVTDTNGCQSFSDDYVLSGPLSVANVSNINDGIEVYPNPAYNVVFVRSANKLRGTLSSWDGRLIYDVPDIRSIDLSALADGGYMLLLYDGQGAMVRAVKLIKTPD